MGSHTMKTTIEIADDLFERARQIARKQKTTFRALVEESLRTTLRREQQPRHRQLPPLVTFGRGGAKAEFKDWDWEQVRDEIYRDRGA